MILIIALGTIPSPIGTNRIQDRFVGAWRLDSLEEEGSDGKIRKADCTGLLVFTPDVHMSVQVMFKNPPAENNGTNSAPVQYSQGGYQASFGTYEIDEPAHTFTFHVEGARSTCTGWEAPRLTADSTQMSHLVIAFNLQVKRCPAHR